jgi:hypothetical protein
MNNNKIRLAYLNCRGLNQFKQDTLFQLVPNKYDILFLSETWYCNHSQYIQHPNFFTSSPLPSSKTSKGRHSGGLLVIVSPLIKKNIVQFSSTQYSIDIKVYNQHIRAIYLPPSLSNTKQKHGDSHYYLSKNSIKDTQPTIILGDFNAFFGIHQPEPSASKSRSLFLKPVLQALKLKRVAPTSGTAKNHHLFAVDPQETKWSYIPPPIYTDHSLMHCVINKSNQHDVPEKEAFRINLRSLKFNFITNHLQQSYQLLSPQYNTAIQELYYNPTSILNQVYSNDEILNTTVIQGTIINNVYEILSSIIMVSAESSCGTYNPSDVCSFDIKDVDIDQWNTTPADTIRLFKYSQRTNLKSITIQSRDPSITPMEDAVNYFSSLFSSPPYPHPC